MKGDKKLEKSNCRSNVPAASSDGIRRRMQATPQRDTPAEKVIRTALHRKGLRFRLHRRLIPGLRRTTDIVFPGPKVAVFVDGCFWHGCPEHGTFPKTNSEWWREKIEANRHRDADTNQRLLEIGWQPVRVWEHEDPEKAAERIEEVIRGRSRAKRLGSSSNRSQSAIEEWEGPGV